MLQQISIEELGDEILYLSKKLNQSSSNYLCFNQACNHLGFTSSFMRKLILEKRIPFIKVSNKKLKFFRGDLDQWITSKRVEMMN
jgi:excisionase family DNA binding protein